MTDYSPPSSVNNYYKGWSITMKFTDINTGVNRITTKKIIHYDGTNKIATLNENIIGSTDTEETSIQWIDDSNNNKRIRSPYILSKNLVSSEVSTIQDSIVQGTYVVQNGDTTTVTLNSAPTSTIPVN